MCVFGFVCMCVCGIAFLVSQSVIQSVNLSCCKCLESISQAVTQSVIVCMCVCMCVYVFVYK